MADKEAQEKVEIEASQIKKTDKVTKPLNAEGGLTVRDKKQTWIVWLVIGCMLVLIGIVALAAFFVHAVRERTTTQLQPATQVVRARGGGFRTSSFYSQQATTDGPTTTTTTTKYTYTEGVVTQVNSGNIVVAGNGKTQTITTNSSTTYDDNTKPAVNDTVVIVGTADSNNNVTATEVRVVNN